MTAQFFKVNSFKDINRELLPMKTISYYFKRFLKYVLPSLSCYVAETDDVQVC